MGDCWLDVVGGQEEDNENEKTKNKKKIHDDKYGEQQNDNQENRQKQHGGICLAESRIQPQIPPQKVREAHKLHGFSTMKLYQRHTLAACVEGQ